MEYSKYQLDIFEAYEKTDKNIVVSARAGCLHPDTEVLMYNGLLKKAKDVKICDLLMGEDSTPRKVLNIDSGVDDMYKIIPVKGEPFIVNSQHILTVYSKKIHTSIRIYKNTKHTTPIIDLPISYFINNNLSKNGEYYKNFNLQRYAVEFTKRKLPIDPYLLGLWLAEGTKEKGNPLFSICASDKEIIEYLMNVKYDDILPKKNIDSENCLRISLTHENYKHSKNILREEFKKCIYDKEIFIPKKYLISSRQQRLELLAGLIDGDGSISNNTLSIVTKFDFLNKDILFLCRSLGFAAYSSLKKYTIKSLNFVGYYHRISISGDLSVIPHKLLRKKCTKRKQRKNVLRTGFKIEYIGKGSWNGFTVDDDNRFLLGDFTITHNSGKTSTLLELLKRKKPHRKAIFLAFNKSIAEELKRRVPFGVDVMTIHSYGAKLLFKYWNGNVEIKPNKIFSFSFKFLKQWGLQDNDKKYQYLGTVSELVDLWRLYLCKNENDLVNIADYQGITCLNGEIKHSLELIEEVNSYNKYGDDGKKQIDFTDMIYLPAIMEDIEFKQYDEVFVDEVQDIGLVHKLMIEKILKKNSRLILVGDEFQSIYQFISANPEVFKSFKERSNTISLPLSISYRCSKKVVEKANTVFNITEPFGKAPDGEVRDGSIREVESGDFVLCRNNQPLIEAYLNFLIQGKKAHIKGRDLGESLLKLVSKIEDMSLSEGQQFLRELLSEVIKDLKNSNVQNPFKHPRYVALKEKIDIISILIDKYGTFQKLQAALKEMFVDDIKDGITLSTIHRAKGLEANRVFILKHELIPSPYAEKKWELDQEQNLRYVAYTRAKEKLIFITDF